ncbi:MAG TPA: acyl carrier protein [Bacilli bacterium]|jgi:acyl carrier protein|nr:acyl carrier protein [Bacilli bacterium]
MKNKIIEILNQIKPGVDYNSEKHLITDGILTSFDIVTLIANLTEEFDIEITIKDVIPENFESIETLEKLVESKEE